MVSGAIECPIDNQGRMLLPAYLREHATLGKEVAFAGVGKRVEIWDKLLFDENQSETQENYAKIFEAGRKAGEDFDGFIAKMDDQIRFLGQDLNPAAISELSDEAAVLNKQADDFFKSITETLKTATDYTTSLKPQ